MPSSFTAFSSFDARPLLLFYCLCLGLDDLCAFWIWGPLGNSSPILFFPSLLLQPVTQHSQTGALAALCSFCTPLRILWSENSVHLLCSDLLVTLPPIILFILYQANPGSCEVLISSPLVFPKSVLHQLSSPFLKSSIHFLCTGSFSLWLEVYLDFLDLRRKNTSSKNFCASLNCYPVPTPFKTNPSYFLTYIWPNYIWLCSCCLFSSSSHRNGSGKVSDG